MEHDEKQETLSPKANHQSDRQPNGSTQRMAAPYDTEPTLSGYNISSARLVDDTANGNLDVKQAQAANAAAKNGISSIQTQLKILTGVDQIKDTNLLRMAADMMGGSTGKRFRELIDARDEQRQIAANPQSGPQDDKPTES
jgi:hypothetical protein